LIHLTDTINTLIISYLIFVINNFFKLFLTSQSDDLFILSKPLINVNKKIIFLLCCNKSA